MILFHLGSPIPIVEGRHLQVLLERSLNQLRGVIQEARNQLGNQKKHTI